MIKTSSKIFVKDPIFKNVVIACPMGSEIPEWLEGASITKNIDGSFSLSTRLRNLTGNMMDSYWVRCGTDENEIPLANILDKSTPYFDTYVVCTEDGQDICPLREFDEGYEQELDYNLSLTPEEYVQQLIEEKGIDIEQDEYDDI